MFRSTLLLISLSFCIQSFAKESLLILGTVFAQGDVCDGAKIYVYENENQLGSDVTAKTGNFYISIPKDKKVILSIEKPGFLGKRVIVDTNAQNYPSHRMTFFCDIDLLEEHIFQGVDRELFEKPLGIVHFNPEVKSFVLDKYRAYWNKKDLRREKRKQRKSRHRRRIRLTKY
jgi:hypothetical protein